MDRVIILNGAPRSGKDTLSQLMFEGHIFEKMVRGSFKRPLQDIAASVLGMDSADFLEQYETVKDLPCPNGLPMTVRELMIKISEEWIKPIGGKRYFGDLAYAKTLEACAFAQRYLLTQIPGTTVVFSDGGFGEEVFKFIECLGANNVYIVRIHRDGFDFSMDSRRLLDSSIAGLEHCQFFDINNNGNHWNLIHNFAEVVVRKIEKDSAL